MLTVWSERHLRPFTSEFRQKRFDVKQGIFGFRSRGIIVGIKIRCYSTVSGVLIKNLKIISVVSQ